MILSEIFMRFYGIGPNLTLVFSSSCPAVSRALPVLKYDGLTVSATFRRVRDVDMKRDYAFVVCIAPSFSFFLTYECT